MRKEFIPVPEKKSEDEMQGQKTRQEMAQRVLRELQHEDFERAQKRVILQKGYDLVNLDLSPEFKQVLESNIETMFESMERYAALALKEVKNNSEEYAYPVEFWLNVTIGDTAKGVMVDGQFYAKSADGQPKSISPYRFSIERLLKEGASERERTRDKLWANVLAHALRKIGKERGIKVWVIDTPEAKQ